jgi:hypothetical protein
MAGRIFILSRIVPPRSSIPCLTYSYTFRSSLETSHLVNQQVATRWERARTGSLPYKCNTCSRLGGLDGGQPALGRRVMLSPNLPCSPALHIGMACSGQLTTRSSSVTYSHSAITAMTLSMCTAPAQAGCIERLDSVCWLFSGAMRPCLQGDGEEPRLGAYPPARRRSWWPCRCR